MIIFSFIWCIWGSWWWCLQKWWSLENFFLQKITKLKRWLARNENFFDTHTCAFYVSWSMKVCFYMNLKFALSLSSFAYIKFWFCWTQIFSWFQRKLAGTKHGFRYVELCGLATNIYDNISCYFTSRPILLVEIVYLLHSRKRVNWSIN